jgi:hypothetical protein
MSTSLPLPAALLAQVPDAVASTRSRGPNNRSPVKDVVIHDAQRAILAAMSRVTGADTTFLTTDGATKTIASYEIDIAAGTVIVGGVPGRLALIDDEDLLSISSLAAAVDLAGGAVAALSADGKTYDVAIVAILISGAVQLAAVFGAEADDTSEVAPTAAQIHTALAAAAIANHDSKAGVVVARVKIKRIATDTITYTHTAAASDDDLWAERQVGTIWPTV